MTMREEIVETQRLYRILGTYAAVSRKLTRYRSPETVARYVKMRGVPRNVHIAVETLLQKVGV